MFFRLGVYAAVSATYIYIYICDSDVCWGTAFINTSSPIFAGGHMFRTFWKNSFGKSSTKIGNLCTPTYKFIWRSSLCGVLNR